MDPVGALGNASHVVLNNGGNGASIVSELATVAPGAFPGAVNATVAWLPRNGAGPADPPVLWVKGDEGAGYGTWTTVATGSSDSQGWGSVVDPDGAYATTFLLPQATDLGVLARASGTGSIYVSACSAASLPDDSLEVCPVHTTVSFGNASPTWSASAGNLTVGPGIVKVTVYGASHSVLLDQLLLTPAPASLLAPCAAGVPTEWTCPGAATAGPSSVSGNPGGPSVTATFPPTSEFPVLAQLVSCDATWRASGAGVERRAVPGRRLGVRLLGLSRAPGRHARGSRPRHRDRGGRGRLGPRRGPGPRPRPLRPPEGPRVRPSAPRAGVTDRGPGGSSPRRTRGSVRSAPPVEPVPAERSEGGSAVRRASTIRPIAASQPNWEAAERALSTRAAPRAGSVANRRSGSTIAPADAAS